MKTETIDPGWTWNKKLGVAAGIRRGNTIYLSGYVAIDGDGNLVGEGDIHAQSQQIFRNIREALASAGASMDDVVKITAYVVDMTRYGEYAKARGEAFPNGVPASTTVGTSALVSPALLVEVEAIAEVDP
jgi:2-iminobutanoate/2-iminopropanoate deaminase